MFQTSLGHVENCVDVTIDDVGPIGPCGVVDVTDTLRPNYVKLMEVYGDH